MGPGWPRGAARGSAAASLKHSHAADLAGKVLKYLLQTEIDVGELNSQKGNRKEREGGPLNSNL